MALYGQHEVKARQQVEKENQRAQPRQQVIDWFTQLANLYQQAAAAQKAQAIQPRQQVIDLFTQLADLHQQAVAEEDAYSVKALSLKQAMLFF
ncbi:MAG: hypothetical protein NT164_04875 [Verrucomicrobiae bacterium]|nr:hypothetical protein [Verrucomicrobiae bacterium]